MKLFSSWGGWGYTQEEAWWPNMKHRFSHPEHQLYSSYWGETREILSLRVSRYVDEMRIACDGIMWRNRIYKSIRPDYVSAAGTTSWLRSTNLSQFHPPTSQIWWELENSDWWNLRLECDLRAPQDDCCFITRNPHLGQNSIEKMERYGCGWISALK